MKKALFVFLMMLGISSLHAQNESQTEYNFLRLPVSAHAAALGGDNITVIENDYKPQLYELYVGGKYG